MEHKRDLVKFVMCTLVSRDSVLFCKYLKRHVYPGNQDTHDKLNQIQQKKLTIRHVNEDYASKSKNRTNHEKFDEILIPGHLD